jgi:hypothetical protein
MVEGDHYREAERLSAPSQIAHAQKPPDPAHVARAQVHATLAVADQLARVAEALEVLVQVQQEGG